MKRKRKTRNIVLKVFNFPSVFFFSCYVYPFVVFMRLVVRGKWIEIFIVLWIDLIAGLSILNNLLYLWNNLEKKNAYCRNIKSNNTIVPFNIFHFTIIQIKHHYWPIWFVGFFYTKYSKYYYYFYTSIFKFLISINNVRFILTNFATNWKIL